MLLALGKFPQRLGSSTTLLFANMGASEVRYILPVAAALRDRGVNVEIFPEEAKLKKQFAYAEHKSVPFLSITGTSEAEAGTVNIKDLEKGDQRTFLSSDLDGMLAFIGGSRSC